MQPRSSFIDTILGFLSSDISIKVSPQQFEFSTKDRSVAVRPVVFVATGGPEDRVLAVGEELSPTEPYIRVHLFERSDHRLGPTGKFACLEAFIRYAFAHIQERNVLVRPRVFISGASSLSHSLGGYEGFLLWKAVMTAGARECHFLA